MIERVDIETHGTVVPLELDVAARRWEGPHVFEEAEFPLVVLLADGKRYALHADGTFSPKEVDSQ